jgi:hypothetical protein
MCHAGKSSNRKDRRRRKSLAENISRTSFRANDSARPCSTLRPWPRLAPDGTVTLRSSSLFSILRPDRFYTNQIDRRRRPLETVELSMSCCANGTMRLDSSVEVHDGWTPRCCMAALRLNAIHIASSTRQSSSAWMAKTKQAWYRWIDLLWMLLCRLVLF